MRRWRGPRLAGALQRCGRSLAGDRNRVAGGFTSSTPTTRPWRPWLPTTSTRFLCSGASGFPGSHLHRPRLRPRSTATRRIPGTVWRDAPERRELRASASNLRPGVTTPVSGSQLSVSGDVDAVLTPARRLRIARIRRRVSALAATEAADGWVPAPEMPTAGHLAYAAWWIILADRGVCLVVAAPIRLEGAKRPTNSLTILMDGDLRQPRPRRRCGCRQLRLRWTASATPHPGQLACLEIVDPFETTDAAAGTTWSRWRRLCLRTRFRHGAGRRHPDGPHPRHGQGGGELMAPALSAARPLARPSGSRPARPPQC